MKKENNLLFFILGMIVLLIIFGGFGPGMRSMMYDSYGSGMMLFGWLYGILIIVALVLFIVWLFQQIQDPKHKR